MTIMGPGVIMCHARKGLAGGWGGWGGGGFGDGQKASSILVTAVTKDY